VGFTLGAHVRTNERPCFISKLGRLHLQLSLVGERGTRQEGRTTFLVSEWSADNLIILVFLINLLSLTRSSDYINSSKKKKKCDYINYFDFEIINNNHDILTSSISSIIIYRHEIIKEKNDITSVVVTGQVSHGVRLF